MSTHIAAEITLKGAEPPVHQQAPDRWQVAVRAVLGPGKAQGDARASFSTADRDHNLGRLDAVAGSEFVDDRIRLRE